MLRKFICFGAGLIVGGVMGWVLGGKSCAKSYKADIDRLEYECAAYRKAQRERYILENEKKQPTVEQPRDEDSGVTYRDYMQADRAYRATIFDEEEADILPQARRATEEALGMTYQSDAYDDHMAQRVAPTDDEESTDPNEIRVIGERDFEAQRGFMDVQTYICYQEDETLTDEDGFIVTEEEAMIIGSEAAGRIYETENDAIYAMDEKKNTLYEIEIKHDGSYVRDVLGCEY